MHPPLTTRQPPRKQKVCGSVKAIMDELTTQMRNGNPDGPIPRHILAWQSKVGFLVRPALFQTRLCAPGVLRCCVPRAACTHYTCHTHVCASLPGMCLHMMHRPCLVLSVWYPSVHMFSAFRVARPIHGSTACTVVVLRTQCCAVCMCMPHLVLLV